MEALDRLLRQSLGTIYTAAQVEVRYRNAVLYRAEFGTLDGEGRAGAPVTRHTRFDYASLTKLFTTLAFFRLVEAGRVQLNQPVCSVLPAFGARAPFDPIPIRSRWASMFRSCRRPIKP